MIRESKSQLLVCETNAYSNVLYNYFIDFYKSTLKFLLELNHAFKRIAPY